MDIYEQMTTRFAATYMPVPSAEVTKDNERLTQWYLEHSFFRDFVYRNPVGRKGKEFSDALVVYDDTIIVIQNKTQGSPRSPEDWAESAVNDAIRQLRGSFRMIRDELVQEFENDVLCTKMRIDLTKHIHIYGMVVLAQDCRPYDAYRLIQKDNWPNNPFAVMTLNDLLETIDRMDTAADFITYFELRYDATRAGLCAALMNDEINTMIRIGESLPKLLQRSLSSAAPDVRERTLRLQRQNLVTRIKDRTDYKFSVLVDDIIARANDVDPDLVEDLGKARDLAHVVGQTYGFLDRERRIAIGKWMLDAAVSARSQENRIIVHIRRPIGQIFIYLFTKADRKLRREYLYAISSVAQEKYKFNKVMAMATEPADTGGRSYDFVHLKERRFREGVDIPTDIIDQLPDPDTMCQMIN